MKQLIKLAIVGLGIALAGCSSVATSIKEIDTNCHVILNGIVTGGMTGVGGNLNVYKECWPEGKVPDTMPSP